VQWLKSGQPWTPDPAESLADNGLKPQGRDPLPHARADGIKGSFS
jgi:phenol hydroxylase P4 protein